MFCSGKAMLFLVLFPLAVDRALAHLDEECKLLSRCKFNMENTYCDNDNYCRCKKGYIKVSTHACQEPQKLGGYCETDIVCKHTDSNMTCVENRCDCRRGYFFDRSIQKCSFPLRKGKGAPLFPLTAVIFIACIGIFCGCGIICHNFRTQPELSQHRTNIESGRRRTPGNSSTSARLRPSTSDGNSNMERAESRASSKYDSLMFDEPPPNYEDAIKDYPTEVMVVQTTAVPERPFLHREPLAKPVKL